MAITGPPPKPANQRRRRNPPAHGWVEVEDRPNLDGPPLPARQCNGRTWPAYAQTRWQAWSQMPYTTRWQPSDWAYAIDSLELVVRASRGDSSVAAWGELRQREMAMALPGEVPDGRIRETAGTRQCC
jgi:hypothetical protein